MEGAGMKKCDHENFECFCDVNRLTTKEVVTSYSLDIQVKCKDCEISFNFIGLPQGFSPIKPMMGAFGYEARLPIEPSQP